MHIKLKKVARLILQFSQKVVFFLLGMQNRWNLTSLTSALLHLFFHLLG